MMRHKPDMLHTVQSTIRILMLCKQKPFMTC
jgi:hypothetical protein